jgi:hypothetical protein
VEVVAEHGKRRHLPAILHNRLRQITQQPAPIVVVMTNVLAHYPAPYLILGE